MTTTRTEVKDKQYYYQLGCDLYNQEKYNEAINALNQCLEMKPDDINALHMRGNSFIYLKRDEEAQADLDKVKQTDPKNHYTHYLYGHGLYYMQKYRESLTAFNECLKIEPDYAYAYLYQGWAPTIHNNKDDEDIHNHHETVLDIAKRTNNKDLISMVATPFLIFAASHGSQDDISSALNAGAKLNGQDAYGQTALHKAVRARPIAVDVIKLLLKKYAEANKTYIQIADKDGKTPYHLAAESGIKIKSKNLEIYLSENFGAYRKEIKLNKIVKLSNSSLSFVASVGQGGENSHQTSLNSNQVLDPAGSNQFKDNGFDVKNKFG